MADHRDAHRSGIGALDRLVADAIAEPVRPAPGIERLAGRVRARQRRRRTLAISAVTVPALALGALWANTRSDERTVEYLGTERAAETTTPDPSPSPTDPTDPTVLLDPVQASPLPVDVAAMAPSPLSAREAAAWTWTGTELVVWGGDPGGGPSGGSGIGRTLLADGAAYEPATDSWRLLPPGPLDGRARATAVWTGSEVVVWGGTTTPDGPGNTVDGAAYDPATDTWRTIAPAPNAMTTFPSAAWVPDADRVVISGGGGDGVDDSRTDWALVYDPVADTWDRVDVDIDVIQVVAVDGQWAALIGRGSDANNAPIAVRWFDPATLEVTDAPQFPAVPGLDPDDFSPSNVGGVWTGDVLVVATSGSFESRWGLSASIRPGASDWRDRRVTANDDDHLLPWPLDIWGMSQPSLLTWTDAGVVAFERGLSLYDPDAGTVRLVDFGLDSQVPCGYDGVSAWTGTEVLVWGGQSCRSGPGVEPTVATGARISFDP